MKISHSYSIHIPINAIHIFHSNIYIHIYTYHSCHIHSCPQYISISPLLLMKSLCVHHVFPWLNPRKGPPSKTAKAERMPPKLSSAQALKVASTSEDLTSIRWNHGGMETPRWVVVETPYKYMGTSIGKTPYLMILMGKSIGVSTQWIGLGGTILIGNHRFFPLNQSSEYTNSDAKRVLTYPPWYWEFWHIR